MIFRLLSASVPSCDNIFWLRECFTGSTVENIDKMNSRIRRRLWQVGFMD